MKSIPTMLCGRCCASKGSLTHNHAGPGRELIPCRFAAMGACTNDLGEALSGLFYCFNIILLTDTVKLRTICLVNLCCCASAPPPVHRTAQTDQTTPKDALRVGLGARHGHQTTSPPIVGEGEEPKPLWGSFFYPIFQPPTPLPRSKDQSGSKPRFRLSKQTFEISIY